MASGILTRIKNIKKLSEEQKVELKESIGYHHESIRQYMQENELPIAVLNALEDRLATLNEAYLKL